VKGVQAKSASAKGAERPFDRSARNLSRLQAEGMIKIDGRSVIICNLKALEAELQSEN
jgi:hypothetical protein